MATTTTLPTLGEIARQISMPGSTIAKAMTPEKLYLISQVMSLMGRTVGLARCNEGSKDIAKIGDHFGQVEFYMEGVRAGVKDITGFDFYLSDPPGYRLTVRNGWSPSFRMYRLICQAELVMSAVKGSTIGRTPQALHSLCCQARRYYHMLGQAYEALGVSREDVLKLHRNSLMEKYHSSIDRHGKNEV